MESPDSDDYVANQTTPEETRYIAAVEEFETYNSGYMSLQNTRPLMPSFALSDSPVGFLAWMLQLLVILSDGYEYTKEEVVTRALTLYIPGIYGSIRNYKETFFVGLPVKLA